MELYPSQPLTSRFIEAFAPGLLSPAGLHGKLRAKMYSVVVAAAGRLAGYEPLPSVEAPCSTASRSIVDVSDRVLVIGAGVAGLAAAAKSAEYGVKVVLAEATSVLGGFVRLLGGEASEAARRLVKAVERSGRVKILTGASYIGLYDEGHAVVASDSILLARRGIPVVYAAGSEAPPPLAIGNDLPGVVSASYLLELVEAGYRPRSIAVIGAGPWAMEVAEALAEKVEKVYVVARREQLVRDAPGRVEVVEAGEVVFQGRGRLDEVPVDGRHLRVEAAASAVSEYPNALAAYAAGYRATYCSSVGTIVPEPVRPEPGWLEDRSWLIPAGSAAGDYELEAALAGGELAGAIAAWRLGRASEEDVKAAYQAYRRVSRIAGCSPDSTDVATRPPVLLSSSVKGLQFVDLDEDIVLGDVIEAWERGYHGMELLKRATGLGTGLEQGRFSAVTAALILSHLYRVPVNSIGVFRARPPLSLPQVSLLA
ncbi:FAD-dependent oxidoreductase [Hyperthermus butylicus]|uniref:FAD-dependent oxidoreductase n=1 Tax=Hyperthermus butylicus TaxID=54248 RepID=UPI00129A2656|nr:FAD-dependent oxidoreductase [Hyperthermus butylicus]